jgi:hypothetical protein
MPIFLATGSFAVRFHEEGHEQDTVQKLFLSKNFVAEKRDEVFTLAMRYIGKKRVEERYGKDATFELIGTLGIDPSVRNRWKESRRSKFESDLRIEQEDLKREVKFQKTEWGYQGMLF